MTEDEERAGDAELRALLVAKLQELEELLLDYPPSAPDAKFNQFQKLAIYYRDVVRRIDEKWRDS